MFNPITILLKRQDLLIKIMAAAILLVSTIGLLSQTASAQTTYVITDGGRVMVHTTYETDPEQVLNEAGLALDTDDIYTTQSGSGVSEIKVQRGQTVTIDNCGNQMEIGTYGETVESLLTRLEVPVDGDTEVSVPLDTMTYDGMELQVSRTVRNVEVYSTTIAYETIYCEDATLPTGTEEVLTEGVDGQLQCTASVVYVDGEETSRTVLSETVLQQPVNAVVAVGTGEAVQTKAEADTDAPIIGDGIITTSTGEVLTYTKVMQVVATGYNKTNAGCDDYTATGTLARVGAIAVDPRMIPYGTRMFIVSNDGEYVYGIATAEDCGGSIKGNRIDLYFDTNYECFQFGIRDCTVYILG